MSEKLATELIASANGDGNAIKKKEDTHRMADANQALPISDRCIQRLFHE